MAEAEAGDGALDELQRLRRFAASSDNQWEAEQDHQLLAALKGFEEKLLERSAAVLEQLQMLAYELNGASVGVETVYNKMQMLSHTQFIEQRVREEAEEYAGDEQGMSTENGIEQNGLDESGGLEKVIQIASDIFTASNLHDEDDDEMANQMTVSEKIASNSVYGQRMLPYIAGTPDYLEDDYAGLAISDSEEDKSEDEFDREDLEESAESDIMSSDGDGKSTDSDDESDLTDEDSEDDESSLDTAHESIGQQANAPARDIRDRLQAALKPRDSVHDEDFDSEEELEHAPAEQVVNAQQEKKKKKKKNKRKEEEEENIDSFAEEESEEDELFGSSNRKSRRSSAKNKAFSYAYMHGGDRTSNRGASSLFDEEEDEDDDLFEIIPSHRDSEQMSAMDDSSVQDQSIDSASVDTRRTIQSDSGGIGSFAAQVAVQRNTGPSKPGATGDGPLASGVTSNPRARASLFDSSDSDDEDTERITHSTASGDNDMSVTQRDYEQATSIATDDNTEREEVHEPKIRIERRGVSGSPALMSSIEAAIATRGPKPSEDSDFEEDEDDESVGLSKPSELSDAAKGKKESSSFHTSNRSSLFDDDESDDNDDDDGPATLPPSKPKGIPPPAPISSIAAAISSRRQIDDDDEEEEEEEEEEDDDDDEKTSNEGFTKGGSSVSTAPPQGNSASGAKASLFLDSESDDEILPSRAPASKPPTFASTPQAAKADESTKPTASSKSSSLFDDDDDDNNPADAKPEKTADEDIGTKPQATKISNLQKNLAGINFGISPASALQLRKAKAEQESQKPNDGAPDEAKESNEDDTSDVIQVLKSRPRNTAKRRPPSNLRKLRDSQKEIADEGERQEPGKSAAETKTAKPSVFNDDDDDDDDDDDVSDIAAIAEPKSSDPKPVPSRKSLFDDDDDDDDDSSFGKAPVAARPSGPSAVAQVLSAAGPPRRKPSLFDDSDDDSD